MVNFILMLINTLKSHMSFTLFSIRISINPNVGPKKFHNRHERTSNTQTHNSSLKQKSSAHFTYTKCFTVLLCRDQYNCRFVRFYCPRKVGRHLEATNHQFCIKCNFFCQKANHITLTHTHIHTLLLTHTHTLTLTHTHT